jgi:hypothetical protein
MTITNVISMTATRTILALDLGKYKSVACRYEPETGEVQFHTVTTDRDEFRRLIERHRPSAGSSDLFSC